jgi:ketosteroid isomerase-like protein
MATILKATTPAEAHRFWGEAFNSRDVDTLLSLYEDGAAMLGDPGGSLAQGREGVREVLEGFLSFGATFTLERTKVLENGDLAIVYSRWRLSGGADPEGKPVDITGETTDVVRQDGEGAWRFAIDNPWGTAAAG